MLLHERNRSFSRRRFISTSISAASCFALAGKARTNELPIVAYVSTQAHQLAAVEIDAFRTDLGSVDCIDGRDMTLQWRSKDPNRNIEEKIFELAKLKPAVFVVSSAGMAALVQAQTKTVPIVAIRAGDLEGSGLIQSQKRPGGNVTGIEILSPSLMAKRFQILKSIVPEIKSAAIVEPITPEAILTNRYFSTIQHAANDYGVPVKERSFHDASEIEVLYETLSKNQEVAFVISNPLSVRYKNEIISASAENAVPSIYESRDFVLAGGLISYGPDWSVLPRLAASYVVKILRGASPADLPVQSPTKFELAINASTARTLKINIPASILAMADLFIE